VEFDGGWRGVLDTVVVFSFDAVTVVGESLDDSRVGSVSAFVDAFKELVDGLADCSAEGVRGKNPPGR
jgi:hypothetical protein